MKILETERLTLRHFTPEDAAFILQLLNEPSFIQNIGDRGVRTLEAAREYIANGPTASYAQFGFGLYLVELKQTQAPIGMCGLIRRDFLEDVDLGYAFLPQSWGQGYAAEAASAVLVRARLQHNFQRVIAIVSPENERSIHLLTKLNFRFERVLKWPTDGSEVKVFAVEVNLQANLPSQSSEQV